MVKCDCVNKIKQNRTNIVTKALKDAIVNKIVDQILNGNVEVFRDGAIHFRVEFEINQEMADVAYRVVDEIVKLISGGDEDCSYTSSVETADT